MTSYTINKDDPNCFLLPMGLFGLEAETFLCHTLAFSVPVVQINHGPSSVARGLVLTAAEGFASFEMTSVKSLPQDTCGY